MNIVECPNHHYYDSDAYSSCPHCENVTPVSGVTQPSMPLKIDPTRREEPEEDNGRVEIPGENDPGETEPKTSKQKPDETGAKTVRYFEAIDNDPVTGWLVCIKGEKNFGKGFPLKVGGNFIGRASEMDIPVAGDLSVSRLKHAVVFYEPKNNIFILQPGESRQLTYLNDSVVLSPTEIRANDVIQVGETKLMFIPCCTDKFKWDDVIEKGEDK